MYKHVSHHHLWTWIRNMELVLNASPAIHSQLETLAVVTLKCKICENGSAQLLHYQDFNSPCDKCLQKNLLQITRQNQNNSVKNI